MKCKDCGEILNEDIREESSGDRTTMTKHSLTHLQTVTFAELAVWCNQKCVWILLPSIGYAFGRKILYSVYLKVDCFLSLACWGDNEHAGETVWIPYIKFISLLPNAAKAWSKRIVMSSGYGNFQTDTEQIKSKETSINCLLTKHRRIGRRGLRTPCNGRRAPSTHTITISSTKIRRSIMAALPH